MARKVIILSVHGENFKGMKNYTIPFNEDVTTISGANAAGKTTVADLISWILSNKDSLGNEKFEIRTLDKNGNKIHFVDIIGEATFLIIDENGERTMTLKKTQKEVWRKKRGSQEQEFAGNQNTFEVDGYPTNETNFKVTIAENIGSDANIKMLMNPFSFPNMDWKDQRKMLTSLIPDMSDVDIAKEIGGYELILDELGKAPSTDEILKKYKAEKKELQKRQTELPTRIDEVSLRKVDVNPADIQKRRDAVNAELADIQKQIDEADAAEKKAAQDQQEAANRIKTMRTELAQLAESVKADYLNEKRELEFQLREKKSELASIDSQIKQEEAYQNHCVGEVKYYSGQVDDLKQKYISTKKAQWDGSTFCPTCGQILPQSQVEKAKQNWQTHQLEELAKIGDDGKKAAAKRDEAKAKADEYGVSIAKLIDSRTVLISESKALEEKLQSLVEPSTDDEEYKRLENLIHKREDELKQMYFAPIADKEALNAKKAECQRQLVNLGIEEAHVQQNSEIDERITSLKMELRDVGEKVLKCEQFIATVEQFVTDKMNRVSELINSMFDGVKFKLWEVQINNGVRETCECTVDGVPFSDLNHGHQILAGVKIIQGFQKIKGIQLPVIIDNAEALSTDNVPQIDGQLILLAVSDEPELMVR